MKNRAQKSERRPTEALDEFEQLLEQVILQEVTQAVWGRFESALQKLDKEGLDILEQHLDGVPQPKTNDKINQKEAGELVKKMKRDLVQHLRKDCNVRH